MKFQKSNKDKYVILDLEFQGYEPLHLDDCESVLGGFELLGGFSSGSEDTPGYGGAFLDVSGGTSKESFSVSRERSKTKIEGENPEDFSEFFTSSPIDWGLGFSFPKLLY